LRQSDPDRRINWRTDAILVLVIDVYRREEGSLGMTSAPDPGAVRMTPERIVAHLEQRSFRGWLTESGALMLQDLEQQPGRWPRSPPPLLEKLLWDNAGAIGRFLEESAPP
jgi:hypothetical protein